MALNKITGIFLVFLLGCEGVVIYEPTACIGILKYSNDRDEKLSHLGVLNDFAKMEGLFAHYNGYFVTYFDNNRVLNVDALSSKSQSIVEVYFRGEVEDREFSDEVSKLLRSMYPNEGAIGKCPESRFSSLYGWPDRG